MVQKVAVVITQIHERRTEAAHASQRHDGSHSTSSADTTMERQNHHIHSVYDIFGLYGNVSQEVFVRVDQLWLKKSRSTLCF